MISEEIQALEADLDEALRAANNSFFYLRKLYCSGYVRSVSEVFRERYGLDMAENELSAFFAAMHYPLKCEANLGMHIEYVLSKHALPHGDDAVTEIRTAVEEKLRRSGHDKIRDKYYSEGMLYLPWARA
jgi:hypothetical protein